MQQSSSVNINKAINKAKKIRIQNKSLLSALWAAWKIKMEEHQSKALNSSPFFTPLTKVTSSSCVRIPIVEFLFNSLCWILAMSTTELES